MRTFLVLLALLCLGALAVWLDRLRQRSPEPKSPPPPPARPVDPLNPPTVKVFRPRSPRVIKCTCHGLPLEVGDSVLWWPVPNSNAVDVFCHLTVKDALDTQEKP